MPDTPQPVSKIIVPVEIWQAQNYWPIKGWSSPLSGCAHYTCQLIVGGGSENFPDDLSPPPGWEWVDKWGLDMSNRYGQPDIEGWFYASTFDRLGEMLKSATGTGIASKTSLVRKRRWVRTMVCTAEDFSEAIRKRIDSIFTMRRNIELSLKEKEQAVSSVKFYEENRSFVFSQSLHLATQGTLNTLSLLKDIGTKLKSMKQYLQERALVEREHAARMEAVAHKYWAANQDSPVKKSQQRHPFQQSAATGDNAYPMTPLKPTPNHSMTFLTPMTDGDGIQTVDSYELFFSKVFATAQANNTWLNDFSNNLIILVTTEIDQMLLEIQSVLKEARASFRKNSDICRLSEAAIRNFLSSVTIAFESVSHASLREVGDLSDELNGLKGGVAFVPSTFSNVRVKGRPMMSSSYAVSNLSATSSFTSSVASAAGISSALQAPKRSSVVSGVDLGNGKNHARDDIWLAVQRYKLAVRDSQEALCVLISESMDLELQHQIFANRVHYLFSSIVRNYCQEEAQMYSTLHGLWLEMMKETTESINEFRAPFPIIQSPFAQLNLTLDDPSFFDPTSPSKGGDGQAEGQENLEQNMDSDDEVDAVRNNQQRVLVGGRISPLQQISSPFSSPTKDDLANMAIGMGVFSFTFLYREPLPKAPGVVRSGNMLCTSTSAVMKSRNVLFDAIWKTVYLVATSDGYVHMLTRRKCDIPERSFYLRESILNETSRDMHQEDQKLIFELSLSPQFAQSKSKTFFQEGVCFRCANEEECRAWMKDLHRLTFSAGHVDEIVEAEVKEAMLQSLPILRGETAKMDLELQKYEVIQQQYEQQQQQQQQNTSLLFSNNSFHNYANQNMFDGQSLSVIEQQASSIEQQQTNEGEYGDGGEPIVTRGSLVGRVGNEEQDNDDDDSDALIDDVVVEEVDQGDDVEAEKEIVEEGGEEGGEEARAYALPNRKQSSLVTVTTGKKSTRVAVVAPKAVAVASTTYKKDDSSWRSLSSVPTTPPSMKPITAFGVAPVNTNLKPKQLIPKADKNVPLARKHSTLIAQYEKGLQIEKEKVASRVTATKDKRLQDVENLIPEFASPELAGGPSLVDVHQQTNNNNKLQPASESLSSSPYQQIIHPNNNNLDSLFATSDDPSTEFGGAESLDLMDDSHHASAPSLLLSSLNSASMDSSSADPIATKKTRRLVKTLSQKFDINAFPGAHHGGNNNNNNNNNHNNSQPPASNSNT